ncbi:MAG: family 78 glycoside hydrolase catalytic domain [Lachnospiraceae bacterium]|nr:family 78 glycoside hydrolase catalytic domain [Lachnospiraceae bacterium]
MKIVHLRVNHLKNPLGYDFSYLTLSWRVIEAKAQALPQVRVVISEKETMDAPVYDSGVMCNFRQCQINVDMNLKPRTRYFWKVMTKNGNGESAESQTAWFETAKCKEPWEAHFIGTEENKEKMPILYRDFQLVSPVKNARLYIFGAGLYEVEINEKKAGDEYLLPGYHSYDMRMEYQTFDITGMLLEGDNRISILLGEGWYKGRFGFDDVYFDLYGEQKKCIAEIYLEDMSGETVKILTDEKWKAYASCVGENGIYDGEYQDDRVKAETLETMVLEDDRSLLTERTNPPIRKVEEFLPLSETNHKDGYLLLDFGESITGWVEFEGELEEGQKIRLQYGEILQSGNFYRDNLRTAKAEFVYISDGRKKTVRPHFTYYGFRYVKVEGLKSDQKLSYKAYRLMSDIEETGKIETSNEKINQLFSNTVRSQKCNFLDIPTDCPQRDERMGWTGDVNIFANTACFHMDSSAFFRHYAKSLYEEQKLLNGAVPFFAPRPKVPVRENTNPFYLDGGACIWGDVATGMPWILYQYYGDKGLLKEQYPMMKLWVEYIRRRVKENEIPDLWQNDRHLGDWLALDNGNINNPIGMTDSDFLASACYYQAALTVSKAAAVLALEEEKEYRELAERIRQAFLKCYFTEDGRLNTIVTQTACAFLLYIGLYPEGGKTYLAQELRRLLAENDGHLNTGFIGTPVLCPVLSESGLNTLAYDLLLNETYPGWLYEVNLGATTVWERWNSLDDNGVITGTGMNSLNHYAYGSIADWMYRYMCGFHPSMGEEVKMVIRPMPDKRFSFVKGSFESVFGTYESEWTYDKKKGFEYKITVPFSANAKVMFSNGESYLLESGVYRFDQNGRMQKEYNLAISG